MFVYFNFFKGITKKEKFIKKIEPSLAPTNFFYKILFENFIKKIEIYKFNYL